MLRVWTGSAWPGLAEAGGLLAQAEAVTVALSPNGAATGMAIAEELIADFSGASVDSTILIPDRAIVLGVSTRTVTVITGATAYDCGIDGEPAFFGGTLGIAPGGRQYRRDRPARLLYRHARAPDRQRRLVHRWRRAHRHPLPQLWRTGVSDRQQPVPEDTPIAPPLAGTALTISTRLGD